MKKRFWGFAALSILLVIGGLCAVFLHIRFSQQVGQNVQLPEEVSALIESYMAAYQIGTEESVEYMTLKMILSAQCIWRPEID